ncbi:MAG TPA: hypothetical protein VJ840_12335 [Gemmatimonadaceae bacterium]|nr:hypothetical protein [Gemmatimonadaceae bacterium]
MRRTLKELVVAPLAFAALVGCASSGGLPRNDTKIDRVQIQGTESSYDIRLTTDAYETKASLDFSADSVWRVVPTAYAAMSIPTEGTDPAHRLFVGNVTAHRRFNSQPLSKYVDCGSSLTGPNADAYDVLMRVQTQVDSVAAGQSLLRTRIEAAGSRAGGTAVRCISTGELERQLSIRVKLLVLNQPAPAQ